MLVKKKKGGGGNGRMRTLPLFLMYILSCEDVILEAVAARL
jgi:hypothetical protein